MVLLWLTEPLHDVRAWIVALGAVLLLLTRLIPWRDVRTMDWSTLLLIAGGITLGAVPEQSGLVRAGAEYFPINDLPRSPASCCSASPVSSRQR